MGRPAMARHTRLIAVLGTLAWWLALATLVFLSPWGRTDWQTAALVLLSVGLVAYGLHRYERVQLGLVEADR